MSTGYTPINTSVGTDPVVPASAGLSPSSQNATGSDAQNAPSVSFDSNSGCLRLTPLLSWNYTSVLSSDCYWYERATAPVGTTGKLQKGNTFTVVEVDVAFAYDPNVPGYPTVVQNSANVDSGGNLITPAPTTGTHQYNRISGANISRNIVNTWLDSQSAQATNQSGNIFAPNLGTGANGFREQAFNELGVLSNDGTEIPVGLIRSNMDFFRCGGDPFVFPDLLSKFAGKSTNLATEYGLTSVNPLPANASFAIAYHYFGSFNEVSGGTDDPLGKPYFRVYFGGQYCFQFSAPNDAYFCPNTTGDESSWTFEKVEGLDLTANNQKELVVLVFEIIGNYIVISNANTVGHKDNKDKHPAWAYIDLTVVTPSSQGFSTPSHSLGIGVRAMDIAFTYVPVVYPQQGAVSISNIQTGYSAAGVSLSNQVDTTTIMGGQINVEVTGDDSSDGANTIGYNISIERSGQVDASPALYLVEISAQPVYSSVGTNVPSFDNRVRKVEVSLGIDSISGYIILDNRDGSLSTVGGVFPITISAGWDNNNTVIFNGFAKQVSGVKNANQSTIQFSLIGADQILRDAIALNLPIYDGYMDTDAVNDLLLRGGWQGNQTNVEGAGYQLSVPALGAPPAFMFAMGTPIWDCLREIGTHAGCWAFVDYSGTFNFIKQDADYGENIETFTEVPELGAYTEWLSLSGVKDESETRNAVMIVGLTGVDEERVAPIIAIQKAPSSPVGNYLGDNVIPWYRWLIKQDPKINTQEAANGIALRLFSNNNRLRLTTTGMVWGNPRLVPWKKISIDLLTDNIGIPEGAEWRIITATHTLDGDTGSYFTTLEVEYCDPRYLYASWWEE